MPGTPVAARGLLLAAGAGSRAGGPKALRRDADGTSWLARSVQVLLAGGCAQVTVVLGCAADAGRQRLDELPDGVRGQLAVAVAPDWAEGPGRSLVCGLAAVQEADEPVLAVHLVDLPDVGSPVVARLLAGSGPDTLRRAAYAGRPGHPVVLGRVHRPGLAAWLGTHDPRTGAAGYLRAHRVVPVECADLASGLDQDGPDPTAPGVGGPARA
ncbi:MAG: nucleotidyltransferase family protein [Friedmanniella sp.]|nr:nucleotidyltransferase family protein [Friedmanniella sp.]